MTKHNDSNTPRRLESKERPSLDVLKKNIETELGNTSDIRTRECTVGEQMIPAVLVWIDGMVNSIDLNSNVLSPIISKSVELDMSPENKQALKLLSHSILTATETTAVTTPAQATSLMVEGWTIILIEGHNAMVAVNTLGFETRSIDEPSSANVIRGPRDGFVESIAMNISLIRRRVRSKQIRVESQTLGSISHTKIALLYVEDRVDRKVLEEVRKRVSKIDIDAVLESHYIEEMIKDSPWSLFPTVYSTERPDDVAGLILDGQVAILVDGTPFVLVLPCTLFHLLKTTEDLYLAYPVATFVRWIRFVGFLLTLLLPATYVGILIFHPEMVPPQLLSSILSARDGVPFPILLEALLMELTFEGLREASVRMPRSVGSAISIVGALVIGESAVQAGIISSPSVIIVAGTAISSFTIPSNSLSGSIRILKFVMLIFASILGLYGIIIGLFIVGIHLSAIKSVGMPYLAPFAPFKKDEAIRSFIRLPWFIQRNKR
ncbi:spore germination protein [Paenibacillus sp. GCM10012307]|uniref:Spore germination protein n=1 Tax=Paenibacillus roseus TaxID=2798579 RepID=A0A934IZ27_9BACL|nr:spore germination protein [Paenibacillus roseus]MBJ6360314.1 spore germination protein [Paenibacillus roseus]